jgi:hypothetical protein
LISDHFDHFNKRAFLGQNTAVSDHFSTLKHQKRKKNSTFLSKNTQKTIKNTPKTPKTHLLARHVDSEMHISRKAHSQIKRPPFPAIFRPFRTIFRPQSIKNARKTPLFYQETPKKPLFPPQNHQKRTSWHAMLTACAHSARHGTARPHPCGSGPQLRIFIGKWGGFIGKRAQLKQFGANLSDFGAFWSILSKFE